MFYIIISIEIILEKTSMRTLDWLRFHTINSDIYTFVRACVRARARARVCVYVCVCIDWIFNLHILGSTYICVYFATWE